MRATRRFACLLASSLLVGLLLVGARALPGAETARPNFVFILADDLGWTDLGCQGAKYYETPNIDRLAAAGMRFTDGYTCGPNCQPTRAALMSGQYAPRTGVYTVGSPSRFDTNSRPLVPVENAEGLATETVTIAEALKQAGYTTGMFGKWHLGNGRGQHPRDQGFDEAIVSMGRHFNFETNPKVEVPDGAYLADFLTDKAVDFLERHKAEPFFLYLPHFGVHSPHEAKPELIARFKDKPAAGGHRDPTYAAMIASVDESVGRVLAKLEALKLTENTLVIFSSDNGGVGGYQAAGIPKAGGITDNAPLRGGKGMLYEGGVRCAYIFAWKGRIQPAAVCHEPILSVDLYPTLLELAGAKAPADHPLDGTSYVGLLKSDGSAKLAREAIYWHFPGYLGAGADGWRTTPAGAIRAGDYKLLEFFEDGRLELYNLKDDVGQKHDLAKSQPQKTKELHDKLAAWRTSIDAPMPTKREPGQASPVKNKAKNKAKKGAKKKAKAVE
ncbi:MAG: sulfatase [Planctomycetaceae bacterium]|nr:sulfatase [Planctomycetaceae bacterium]